MSEKTACGKANDSSTDVPKSVVSEPWHCEECGEQKRGTPASTETYPGVEGDVELWFCQECTRYER